MQQGVSFNVKWVKTKTQAQFIKAFAKIYPKLDLKEIYKELTKK